MLPDVSAAMQNVELTQLKASMWLEPSTSLGLDQPEEPYVRALPVVSTAAQKVELVQVRASMLRVESMSVALDQLVPL